MTVSTPSRIAEAVTAAYLRELTHVTPEPSLPTWRSAAPATHAPAPRRTLASRDRLRTRGRGARPAPRARAAA